MAQQYQIVCVTKRTEHDEQVDSHLPPRANTAIVDNRHVEYNGTVYTLKYKSTGLDGNALLFGLADGDNVLELYTDTPAEGSGATPEHIRGLADRAMNQARQGRATQL